MSRLPVFVRVLAGIGAAVVVLPLLGVLARTPWSELGRLLTSGIVGDALRVSTIVSLSATLVAVVLGVPLALVLARSDGRLALILRATVLLPIVLPPVVGGAALLFALGRRGIVGEALESATGLVLPFSTSGAVIAATFVAMPFLVLTVEGALRNLDTRFEGAASSLGASDWTVLRSVTLPMIAPSIVAGSALTWARALGEFGATVTFAGNLPGTTQTLPLAVFVALEQDREAAIAISLLMIVISIAVLILLRRRWWSPA